LIKKGWPEHLEIRIIQKCYSREWQVKLFICKAKSLVLFSYETCGMGQLLSPQTRSFAGLGVISHTMSEQGN